MTFKGVDVNVVEKELAKPADAAAAMAAAAEQSGSKLRRATIVTVVVIGLGTAAGLVPRWHQRAALALETQEASVQTVSVASPVPGKAPAGLALPAEVKPFVESPIYARANGYLKRWLVDIGTPVKEGQLLAEIDTPELDQDIARARAEVAQAEAALALAKTTADRWNQLLKNQNVSEQEAAEKQSDLQLKRATVEAARANVRRLEEIKLFSRVTAPFAGTITVRKTDVGELIGSGKELFRLAQTRMLRVFVHVPQTAVRAVVAGQIAELIVPEIPGRIFPAKIMRTSGAMNAQSRTLLTELEVDNTRDEILAGSYSQVRFPEMKLDAVLTLASNTLIFRGDGPQVGVVAQDGKVRLQNITLGRDFGPTVEVLSGVTATDRVIVNPPDSLVGGTVVRVHETAAVAAK